MLARRHEEIVPTAAARRDLVTMDLLGGGAVGGTARRRIISTTTSNKESDAHRLRNLQFGWEKRLHPLTGEALGGASDDEEHRSKIRAYRTNNSTKPSLVRSSPSAIPPSAPPSLDLKLFTPGSECGSVCTLDKVKLALDRVKQDVPRQQAQQYSIGSWSSPTSSTSSTTASSDRQNLRRRTTRDDGEQDTAAPGLQAAGCPSCLAYVLIERGNSRCHRCNSAVHVPPAKKKLKIDLNSY